VPSRGMLAHLAIKTPWAEQCGVERVGPVGRHQNLDVAACLEAVELVNDLEHRALDLVVAARAVVKTRAANRVDLIDEDDARLLAARHLEELAHHACALAHVLLDCAPGGVAPRSSREDAAACAARAQRDRGQLLCTARWHAARRALTQLRADHSDEACVRAVGDGARCKRLSGARRPVQQDALGRVDPELHKAFGMQHRQLEHLRTRGAVGTWVSASVIGDAITTRASHGRRPQAQSAAAGGRHTSRSFWISSLLPPMSLYVMSGFSSTVIIVTVGSIFGGSGIWICRGQNGGTVRPMAHGGHGQRMVTLCGRCTHAGKRTHGGRMHARGGRCTHAGGARGGEARTWYLLRSTPTRMPSSMSAGATRSPKPTTNLAICLTLITYLASSVLGSMILVHRATWQLSSARMSAAGSLPAAAAAVWMVCVLRFGAHLERLLLLHHLLVGNKIPLRGRCEARVALLDAHHLVDARVELLDVVLDVLDALAVRADAVRLEQRNVALVKRTEGLLVRIFLVIVNRRWRAGHDGGLSGALLLAVQSARASKP
jgi:hypothetical protein